MVANAGTGGQDGVASALIEMEPGGVLKKGSRMAFHDLTYKIYTTERCGCCKGGREREILKGVSGVLAPGLNAIMGPTGSGKTTLLDALAGRKDPKGLRGQVFLDDGAVPKNFRYISGYVVQNDLLIGTITVREALWFCANLRLPSSFTHHEKKERIHNVIKDLGLTSCADTKIGNDRIRGISGGEKKRTSIALEMILQPQILFLDEPTTGLDSSTAISVMDLLKKLGKQGNTIVCSIHQPRYSIYKLFDSLTLLSNGSLLYQGPSSQVLTHFESLGYACQPHDNPADFILDVLHGRHDRNMVTTGTGEDAPFLRVAEDEIASTERFRNEYAKSTHYQAVDRELEALCDSHKNGVKVSAGAKSSQQMYANGTFHQLRVLLGRTFLNILRNPAALIGNVILNIVIGVVFGLLYFQIKDDDGTGVQNRSGIIFFVCTSLLFGSISVISAFTAEREIFVHEYVSGYNRVISYFLAKVLADLIPLRTIAPIIFGSITYWMVGLKPELEAFLIFLLTCILLGYSSVGIGLFYSASFQPAVAHLLLVLTYVFTIIYTGLLVNVDEMLPVLSWVKYLSVARYGLVGFSVNEFRGRTFCQRGNTTLTDSPIGFSGNGFPENVFKCRYSTGEEYLHDQLSVGRSVSEISEWDLWVNQLALTCICIVLYTLTYIQLLRIRKYS